MCVKQQQNIIRKHVYGLDQRHESKVCSLSSKICSVENTILRGNSGPNIQERTRQDKKRFRRLCVCVCVGGGGGGRGGGLNGMPFFTAIVICEDVLRLDPDGKHIIIAYPKRTKH